MNNLMCFNRSVIISRLALLLRNFPAVKSLFRFVHRPGVAVPSPQRKLIGELFEAVPGEPKPAA